MIRLIPFLVILLVFLVSCGQGEPTATALVGGELQLTSSAFASGAVIPSEYTCDGSDHSPPLAWSDPPPGTVAFVLLVEDPDAPGGVFTHWLLYDIPAQVRELAEALPSDPVLSDGAKQGRNDFGTIGYRGPCPPKGSAHRYVFRLYALDQPTGLESSARRDELLNALAGQVRARGELVGIYRR